MTKVVNVDVDSAITKALIAKLATVEVVKVVTKGHIDHGSRPTTQDLNKALQALGLSAEEAASRIRDFVEVVRPEPIRIHNFHGLEQRLTLKELKVEAPKPWERESWRRKKKGRT
ncbi:MAG: hypothetical protein GY776_15835 [Alteromonas sp.]|nr:hypothetical protein [Alteromonas sp.]